MKYLTLGKKSHLTILLLALIVALIYSYSGPTLLAIAAGYGLSGIAVRIYNLLRRKRPGDELPLTQSLQQR